MKEKSLVLSSMLAAFVASLCCVGPLVLGGLGLSAALVATFAPLRLYFLGTSGVLLALAYYFVYRKPKAAQPCAEEVCVRNGQATRLIKPLLWLSTLAVAALAFFPSYGAKLTGMRTAADRAATARLETIVLKVSGMSCEACAGLVKRKLLEIAGVAEAEVEYPAGRATVRYDPQKANPAKLMGAVNAMGYKAERLPAATQQPEAASKPVYQVLSADLEALRQRFNGDTARPRVVMLLSPT